MRLNSMLMVSSYLSSNNAPPDCAATVWKDAAGRIAAACEEGGASRKVHPPLVIFSPFFFTNIYSASGIVTTKRALSVGVNTDSAVARAPAVAGVDATTVELMISSAGRPGHGAPRCE